MATKSTFQDLPFKDSLLFSFDLSEELSVFEVERKVDICFRVEGLRVVALKIE
jgi:hypothetical protein